MLIFSFSFWSFIMIFIHSDLLSKHNARFLYNLNSISWIGFISLFIWFNMVFLNKKSILQSKIFYILLAAIPAVFITMQWNDLLLKDYVKCYYGWNVEWKRSIGTVLFFTYFGSVILTAFYLLMKFISTSADFIKKKQAKIILATSITAGILGTTTDILLPILNVYIIPNAGVFFILIWAYGLFYASVKFRFMDITPSTAADNIISTMPDGLLLLDQKGLIININSQTVTLLGFDKEEIEGKPVSALFIDEDKESGLFEMIIQGDELNKRDLYFKTKDGNYTPVSLSRSFLYNDLGKKSGIVCIITDMKDYINKVIELQRSETKYRTILETIHDAYYEVDLLGNYTLFNQAMCDMLGYTRDELIGLNFTRIMDETDAVKIHQQFNAVYTSGEPVVLYRSKFIRKDGSELYGEVSASLIVKNRGEKRGFRGIIRDVTALTVKENALIDSEKKWRILYGSLPGGSIIINDQHMIEDVNTITCKLTGYTYQELVGEHCSIICPDAKSSCNIFLSETDEIDNAEMKIRKKNGDILPVLKSAKKISRKDDSFVIENFLDISEMKNVEDALRKSEEALRLRNEVIEKDLEMAQLIQRSLITSKIPKVAEVIIDYKYYPLDAVGGDYFSFTPLEEGGLGVFIGDVSNHGVTAALFLSLIKATTDRICRNFALDPKKYIYNLNKELLGNMPMSFLTAVYCLFQIIDDASGKKVRFTQSNAGHPYPIFYRASTGDVTEIMSKGRLAGIFDDISIEEKSVILEKGDRIFLYTDGIPETMNLHKEMIGYDRLPEMIRMHSHNSLNKTLDAIIEDVQSFKGDMPYDDDIILIGFEVR